MTELRKLTLRFAGLVALLAAVAGLVVWYYFGGAEAGGFLYGAALGIASFSSTALSVAGLTGRSDLWRAVGVGSFALRYGIVLLALWLPASYAGWPVVAMAAGFAGVYLSGNVLLLPRVTDSLSGLSRKRGSGLNKIEQKVEV